MGIPIWDALVKCPQGIYIKRDFRWYEALSRRMLAIVRDFSPRIEYYSIDEFFFEALPLPGKTLLETAEIIRDRIKEEIRVPVTVGIARSRTLAKLISDGEPVTPIHPRRPFAQGTLAWRQLWRGGDGPDRALCLACPQHRATDREI